MVIGAAGIPVEGASDHGVSETSYLQIAVDERGTMGTLFQVE